MYTVEELSSMTPSQKYDALHEMHDDVSKCAHITHELDYDSSSCAYVYVICNTLNDRMYVGARKIRRNETFASYMGSCTWLRNSIVVHGIDQFEKSILFYFNSMQEAYIAEALIVDQQFIQLGSDFIYNRSVGGRHFTGHKHSRLVRNTITGEIILILKRELQKYLNNDFETWCSTKNKRVIRHTTTQKYFYVLKTDIQKYLDTGDYELYSWSAGTKLTAEQRKRVSIGTKRALADPAVRAKISRANLNRAPEIRARQGRTISNTWKTNKNGATDRLSASVTEYYTDPKNRKKTAIATIAAMKNDAVRQKCATACKDKRRMNNGTQTKMIHHDQQEQFLAMGWSFGFHKKMCWIKKDGDTKRVSPANLQKYISNGWSAGR